jgi:hypothetical protein
MLPSLLLALVIAAPGRPLFYWGALPPVIRAERGEAGSVTEVHAARDSGDLVLRFSFASPVAELLRLPDGTPVSGRLRAVLYLDTDDDAGTGLEQGADPRTGAERRLEVGVVSVGADPEAGVEARAVVVATLASLRADGRRRTLWRADDAGDPARVSARGEWLELRVPADRVGLEGAARLVLATGRRTFAGRLAAP